MHVPRQPPLARRRRGLVALVAVLVVMGIAAANAAASVELAMQDDAVLVNQKYGNSEFALRAMVGIKTKRLRINMVWSRTLATDPTSTTVPSAPSYDWRNYDRAVDAARLHGLHVQLTVYGPAPAWATGNGLPGVYSPSPTLFGQFMRDVAQHFRGRVDRYGAWNEPNLPTFLTPQEACDSAHRCHHVSPGIYRNMYIAARNAVKSVDPTAQVLMGETAPGARPTADLGISIAPVQFMREMLCINPSYSRRTCPPLETDGWAHHPYQLGKPPTYVPPGLGESNIGSLWRFTHALRQAKRLGALITPGGRQPSLYLTEFGYKTLGSKAVSEADQSRYLSCSLQLAQQTRGVAGLVLYQLMDPGPDEQFFSGLIRHDGTPKPSYLTLAKDVRVPCPTVDATVVFRTPVGIRADAKRNAVVVSTGIEVTCPLGGTGRCPVKATLSTTKRFPATSARRFARVLVGRSSSVVREASAARIKITLSKAGVRLLRKQHRLAVRATLQIKSGRRAPKVSRRVFRIKPPRR